MSVRTAQETVMEILEEFAEDWGLDDIEMTPETFLKADLGFESTDTMQLFTAVQENYPAMKFTFQDLVVRDEKFVDDLQIKEIVTFIQTQLQSSMKKLQEG
jgi:acyl carrier protein